MNVILPPQLEDLVRRKVDSGLYSNASDVIREALRQMDERDQVRLRQLRAEIKKGLDQLERGEGVEWTPELMERLKQEAAENARLGKPVHDAVKP